MPALTVSWKEKGVKVVNVDSTDAQFAPTPLPMVVPLPPLTAVPFQAIVPQLSTPSPP